MLCYECMYTTCYVEIVHWTLHSKYNLMVNTNHIAWNNTWYVLFSALCHLCYWFQWLCQSVPCNERFYYITNEKHLIHSSLKKIVPQEANNVNVSPLCIFIVNTNCNLQVSQNEKCVYRRQLMYTAGHRLAASLDSTNTSNTTNTNQDQDQPTQPTPTPTNTTQKWNFGEIS